MDQASKLRQLMGNEDNRQLTDIEYGNSNAKVIVVTSGKGGVGKTSFSVNAAMEFARKGKKVVIFDADFGLANVEVMLGIRPKYNLLDLINNNMSMEDIITQGPENIGFISGGSG
ncbi:MAG: P-loop NTPase, partial [Lachnospiraceae bacterium]|nr:P-loop NTPase [Lachnospiraceae bacterium]